MIFEGLIRASGQTLVTTVAVAAIVFVSSVITARVLGPEGRGLLSAALLVCTVAAGAAQLGLANAFVYYKGARRDFHYGTLLALSPLLAAAVSGPVALSLLQFSSEAQLHGQTVLILCCAGFMAAQGYFSTLSQQHHDLRAYNRMRFGLAAGNLALLLGLITAIYPVGYTHILVAQLAVVSGLVCAGLFWSIRHSIWRSAPSGRGRAGWKEVIFFGLQHHGSVLLGLVLVNFDKIALLYMGTTVQFGFYAIAFGVSRLIGSIQEAGSTALYARFAGGNPEELSRYVRAAFRVTFLPMLAVAGMVAAAAPWLVVTLYGAAFAAVAAPLAVLLFECVIGCASWTLAQQFIAGGRPGLVLARQLVSVVPVFAALPFLPQADLPLYLSLLMLCGSVLRLIATLAIYRLVLKEPVPRMLPTRGDWTVIRQALSGTRPDQATPRLPAP